MAQGSASSLVLDAAFDAEDPRFVEFLREVDEPRRLAAIVDRWKRDARPWARAQQLAYLDLPFDRRGHEVVVKRLFKQAEERGDDEILAACMAAFDRIVRRRLVKQWRWDRAMRQTVREEVLVLPRDRMPPVGKSRKHVNPRDGSKIERADRVPKNARLFTQTTRRHLRRRAWRHFRRMGFQRPEAYVGAVAAALRLATDDDLAAPGALLECWGLLHACFGRHDALAFDARRATLKPGRGLSELTAAPRFPALWAAPGAAVTLLGLVTSARSRLVRTWAMDMVRRDHVQRIVETSREALIGLLQHDDDEVQLFGAELLEHAPGLERLPLDTWLAMLDTRGDAARETVARLFAKFVAPQRLSTEQAVELACRAPASISRIGLKALEGRAPASPAELDVFADLADARSEATGAEAGALGLWHVGADEVYDRERVTRFFDGRNASVRAAAWAWIERSEKARGDADLWARLCETPYDDTRQRLLAALDRRASEAPPSADALAPVWSAVLLAVHRGGRARLRSLRQLAEAMAHDAAQAERLLPVLAIAVRSVRGPDRRAALAAAAHLAERRPETVPRLAERLPELAFDAAGATS